MVETAINVSFEANEIKDIIGQEVRKRLDGLSPLTGSKEYSWFAVDFEIKIRYRRAGEQDHETKQTLAWGNTQRPPNGIILTEGAKGLGKVEHSSTFVSKDPNEERLDRDMPLTVETGDGRGGRLRKKVRVKI
jgi:hypothetical protein